MPTGPEDGGVRHRTYDFSERWLLPRPPPVVRGVLADLAGYPTWWPQVRAVARVDDDRALVVARSRLPFSLDLLLTRVEESQARLRVDIDGGLRGWAEFVVVDDAAGGSVVGYRQQVVLANAFADLAARPVAGLLRWNHAVMMRGARAGLEAALR
jgi:hypothetical protein